ncbi:hypothetical protein OC861_005635 [Tilletia horrida]|nr:hypothetical protein OC861_005635 [Tilletia horrida]
MSPPSPFLAVARLATLLCLLATVVHSTSIAERASSSASSLPVRILPPTSIDWTAFESSKKPASYLLVNGAFTSFSQAADACAALNERLPDPASLVRDDNLRRQLAYLVYEQFFDQSSTSSSSRREKAGSGVTVTRRASKTKHTFWAAEAHQVSIIANSDGSNATLAQTSAPVGQGASGTGYAGRVGLPALCTNSAPWNTVNSTDTSALWRMTVPSGSGTQQTTYTGFRDLLGFRFAAIPYAKTLARFEQSVALTSSAAVYAQLGPSFDALRTTRANQCPQTAGTDAPYTEDCLLLNIATGWLPHTSRPAKQSLRPVILWIHGGGFTSGSGLDGTFDGTFLSSRQDVVVVTPNYRLGTLGWLAVSESTSPALTGNFGLGDLISALQWIRANIQAFGGDPARISVMGQSAGAQAVQLLLQSEAAKGLFQSAAVMSGRPWDQADARITRALAEQPSSAGGANGLAVLQSLGCAPEQVRRRAKLQRASDEEERRANSYNPTLSRASSDPVLDCLRRLPTDKFLTSSVASKPVVDGTLIKQPTLDLSSPASAKSNVNRVPLLYGTMRDELGSLGFVPNVGTSLSDSLTQAGIVDPQKSAVVNNTKGAFPLPRSGRDPVQNLTVTVETEFTSIKRCGHDSSLSLIASNSVFPRVHAYEFYSRAWQIPNFDPNAVCAPESAQELRSGQYYLCHSGELMAVFGTPGFQFALRPRDALDLSWIRSVLDAWATFARTGGATPVMDSDYANIRGYLQSRAAVSRWKPLGAGRNVALLGTYGVEGVRTLGQGSFAAQCSALGLGINYIKAERA